jgi:hypothetical protein
MGMRAKVRGLSDSPDQRRKIGRGLVAALQVEAGQAAAESRNHVDQDLARLNPQHFGHLPPPCLDRSSVPDGLCST